jgi:hypothetical protein
MKMNQAFIERLWLRRDLARIRLSRFPCGLKMPSILKDAGLCTVEDVVSSGCKPFS